MKPIILSEQAWKILLNQLHQDYPTSVLAIRSNMVRVLGFSYRSHQQWVDNPDYKKEIAEYEKSRKDNTFNIAFMPNKGEYFRTIHLDFYSEQKQTFFLLKYSEFIHGHTYFL